MKLPLCVIALATVLLLAMQAQAELPPLSNGDRVKLSDTIVNATVGVIAKTETGTATYSDDTYAAEVVVTGVHKSTTAKIGDKVTVHYWQAGRRPSGWAGPGGQYNALNTGDRVKLFLTGAGKNRYELLNPNGWVKLPPENRPKEK